MSAIASKGSSQDPIADADPLEDSVLPRLTSLLEDALEIVSSSGAMSELSRVAELCEAAAMLARAASAETRP